MLVRVLVFAVVVGSGAARASPGGPFLAVGPWGLPLEIRDTCAGLMLAGEALRRPVRAALDADLDRARSLGLDAWRTSLGSRGLRQGTGARG